MGAAVHRFSAPLWRYPGEGGWTFVTLPTDLADEIADTVGARPGFGAVPVEVRIGDTRWTTSIFPDKKAASYLLPVKRAVRDAEGLRVGDTVTVELGTAPHP